MKKTIHENHRLVVTPDGTERYGFYRQYLDKFADGYHEKMMERCQEMEQQIRRHVDNLATGADGRLQRGSVQIEYDTRHECSFCGLVWEELSKKEYYTLSLLDELEPGDRPGLPQCCEKAQEQWREENVDRCKFNHSAVLNPYERCEEYAEDGDDYCIQHQEVPETTEPES